MGGGWLGGMCRARSVIEESYCPYPGTPSLHPHTFPYNHTPLPRTLPSSRYHTYPPPSPLPIRDSLPPSSCPSHLSPIHAYRSCTSAPTLPLSPTHNHICATPLHTLSPIHADPTPQLPSPLSTPCPPYMQIPHLSSQGLPIDDLINAGWVARKAHKSILGIKASELPSRGVTPSHSFKDVAPLHRSRCGHRALLCCMVGLLVFSHFQLCVSTLPLL